MEKQTTSRPPLSTHGSTQSERAERSLERASRHRGEHARPSLPAFSAPLTHAHEVWR